MDITWLTVNTQKCIYRIGTFLCMYRSLHVFIPAAILTGNHLQEHVVYVCSYRIQWTFIHAVQTKIDLWLCNYSEIFPKCFSNLSRSSATSQVTYRLLHSRRPTGFRYILISDKALYQTVLLVVRPGLYSPCSNRPCTLSPGLICLICFLLSWQPFGPIKVRSYCPLLFEAMHSSYIETETILLLGLHLQVGYHVSHSVGSLMCTVIV
jgi:hypothetical protein